MSQEGYESSSSSEGEEEFGLSPYMFVPERTPSVVENLLKELELKQNRRLSSEKYKNWNYRLVCLLQNT